MRPPSFTTRMAWWSTKQAGVNFSHVREQNMVVLLPKSVW